MKAISIRQPWAWLIATGIKDVENRDWPTAYRGQIAIHAGKAKAPAELLAELRAGGIKIDPADLVYGAVIATAELTDCVEDSDSEWFEGPFGFTLANATRIKPVFLPGNLGIFTVNL